MKITTRCTALLAAVCLLGNAASAAPITFNVVDSLSSLSITPAAGFSPGSAPTQPQGAGAWSTKYSGIVVADVTTSTIQLLPTTQLVAGISGNWSPGLNFPLPADSSRAETVPAYVNSSVFANYGTTTNLSSIGGPAASNSAIRNLQISLADSAPKPLTAGLFDEAGSTPAFKSGIIYLSYGSTSPNGPLTNLAGAGIVINPTTDYAGTGSLVRTGNLLTLTVPVQFSESHFFGMTTFYGTIVATANVPVPEPATFGLLAVAAPLGLMVRRSLKK
ncbi:hypothetical protein [Lacipirellula sp.]|uniref:hypothetical protein n=1 Tax=Lacipirellula sp. TaxID=2691419 RepID=UPI003D0F7C5F